jgi:hypothetical protein
VKAASYNVQSDFDVVQALSIFRISEIKFNFSILESFFKLVFFFRFYAISYECSFFANIQDFCTIIGGFFKGKVLNCFVSFCSLLLKNLKFFNSVISRIVDNYYSGDFVSRNSRVLSLMASKSVLFNFLL